MSKKNEVGSVSAVASDNVSNVAAQPVIRKAMSAAEFLDCATVAAGDNRRNDEVFRNVEISDVTVENKSFAGMEFHYSHLTHGNFQSCKLNRSEFKFAELEDVEFRDCAMEGSYFNFAKLGNVRFVNCILDNSEFDFTSGSVSFEHCSLKCTEFPSTAAQIGIQRCSCLRAEFNACRKLNINAESSSFQRAEFNGTKMCGSMQGCALLYTDFDGCDGSSCKFVDCNIYHVSADDAVGIGNSQHGAIDEELEDFLDSIDVDEDEDETNE